MRYYFSDNWNFDAEQTPTENMIKMLSAWIPKEACISGCSKKVILKALEICLEYPQLAEKGRHILELFKEIVDWDNYFVRRKHVDISQHQYENLRAKFIEKYGESKESGSDDDLLAVEKHGSIDCLAFKDDRWGIY